VVEEGLWDHHLSPVLHWLAEVMPGEEMLEPAGLLRVPRIQE
jgi:hypothetical protein